MYEILQIATHLVGVRGYGMMYCNANGGKLQRHFGVLRGHGHDKSDPYAYGVDVERYINKQPRVVYLLYKMYDNEHSAISIYCANVWQRALRKA